MLEFVDSVRQCVSVARINRTTYSRFPLSVLTGTLRRYDDPLGTPLLLHRFREASRLPRWTRADFHHRAWSSWGNQIPQETATQDPLISRQEMRRHFLLPKVAVEFLCRRAKNKASTVAWFALCIHGPQGTCHNSEDLEIHKTLQPVCIQEEATRVAARKEKKIIRKAMQKEQRSQFEKRARAICFAAGISIDLGLTTHTYCSYRESIPMNDPTTLPTNEVLLSSMQKDIVVSLFTRALRIRQVCEKTNAELPGFPVINWKFPTASIRGGLILWKTPPPLKSFALLRQWQRKSIECRQIDAEVNARYLALATEQSRRHKLLAPLVQ
jgi:hypothetical protein